MYVCMCVCVRMFVCERGSRGLFRTLFRDVKVLHRSTLTPRGGVARWRLRSTGDIVLCCVLCCVVLCCVVLCCVCGLSLCASFMWCV
jgi:hypothetical protein